MSAPVIVLIAVAWMWLVVLSTVATILGGDDPAGKLPLFDTNIRLQTLERAA